MAKLRFTKMDLGVFLAWSMRYLGALLFTCICLVCLAAALHAQTGAIVVSSDEWFTSDTNNSLDNPCCQDRLFATNIAKFLVPVGGTILIQSQDSIGLGGTSLKTLLTGLGATVFEDSCDNSYFLGVTFDAIFVSGNPNNCNYSPLALVTYVHNGGHVFLEVGTGCCGGAGGEAATWNAFLNPFGLSVAASYQLPNQSIPVSTFRVPPLGNILFGPGNFWCHFLTFCPVNFVYYNGGQDISQVVPTESCNVSTQGQVFSEIIGGQMHGLYAALKCCPMNGRSNFFQTPLQGVLGQEKHLIFAKSLVDMESIASCD